MGFGYSKLRFPEVQTLTLSFPSPFQLQADRKTASGHRGALGQVVASHADQVREPNAVLDPYRFTRHPVAFLVLIRTVLKPSSAALKSRARKTTQVSYYLFWKSWEAAMSVISVSRI